MTTIYPQPSAIHFLLFVTLEPFTFFLVSLGLLPCVFVSGCKSFPRAPKGVSAFVCEYSPIGNHLSTLYSPKRRVFVCLAQIPGVGAALICPLGNNTPSECLESYTTKISSSLSVVSGLRLCHSFTAWAQRRGGS